MSRKTEVFKSVLSKFENEEFRLYCEDMIEQMPNYIFYIPSSTSLKYHNENQRNYGGQIYHVLMVGTIMNHILDLEYVQKHIKNSKKRDSMRVAALLHDGIKCGWNTMFDGTHTKHEHPILAGNWVECATVDNYLPDKWKIYISRLIKSHSGQWNTNKRSEFVLPKPKTKEQFLVHLADYLGSRPDLNMVYTEYEINLVNKLVGEYLC